MKILVSCLIGSALTSIVYATEIPPSSQGNPILNTQEQEVYVTDKILLQALDKVTGRVITLEAEMNKPIAFGTLRMIPRLCQKAAPEDPPESTAFLEIFETKPNSQEDLIFQGWMFASYPAVSALEHPVYDVWVKECSGSITHSKKLSLPSLTENKTLLSDEMKAFYQGLGEIPEANTASDEQNKS